MKFIGYVVKRIPVIIYIGFYYDIPKHLQPIADLYSTNINFFMSIFAFSWFYFFEYYLKSFFDENQEKSSKMISDVVKKPDTDSNSDSDSDSDI